MKVKTKKEQRNRRHLRLRQKVRGTADRPRMSVFLSNQHIYVQFVDDDAGRTLAAASSHDKSIKGASKPGIEIAKTVGKLGAEAAKKAGVSVVVFDRGGFRYGGRVKAVADAAREAGLQL